LGHRYGAPLFDYVIRSQQHLLPLQLLLQLVEEPPIRTLS
jgi:hypothetical protein